MPNLNNRFSVAPSDVMKQRSSFDMPYKHLTTGNFGKLIPFYLQEVLPGDTFEVTTSLFSRMSTPLYPVMDNAYINYYYFFVPNRLVWDRWAEFLGENKLSAWVPDTEYIIPHAELVSDRGSLSDHMGVPTYDEALATSIGMAARPALDVSFLPFRAYWLIWNEWFRNENTTDPILVNLGDDVTEDEKQLVKTLQNVSKPFDVFTSALPSPQKGDAVDLPLDGLAPVITGQDNVIDSSLVGLRYQLGDGRDAIVNTLGAQGRGAALLRFPQNNDGNHNGFKGQGEFRTAYYNGVNPAPTGGEPTGSMVSGTYVDWNATSPLYPLNLHADLSALDGVGITVNNLRQAVQMQRLLELQARAGTRYTEIIRASFSVVSPDARLQRPEYLGGTRVQIQMQQVAQTSASNDESPLGKVGAYSKTVSLNRDFSQSFTEHGYIIGVMCARHDLTYQQGLNKMWSRRGRYDFYWPTFAHIGEQPIYNKELFATGDPEKDDLVFGYNEAWAEYRYKPNEVTGAFRSTVDQNLDEWHYADFYQDTPILSEEWMQASAVDVDRTLAVTSSLHDQLLFDIRVDARATRVMPLYSVPGLLDRF